MTGVSYEGLLRQCLMSLVADHFVSGEIVWTRCLHIGEISESTEEARRSCVVALRWWCWSLIVLSGGHGGGGKMYSLSISTFISRSKNSQ